MLYIFTESKLLSGGIYICYPNPSSFHLHAISCCTPWVACAASLPRKLHPRINMPASDKRPPDDRSMSAWSRAMPGVPRLGTRPRSNTGGLESRHDVGTSKHGLYSSSLHMKQDFGILKVQYRCASRKSIECMFRRLVGVFVLSVSNRAAAV